MEKSIEQTKREREKKNENLKMKQKWNENWIETTTKKRK